jgi:hypothetical protein
VNTEGSILLVLELISDPFLLPPILRFSNSGVLEKVAINVAVAHLELFGEIRKLGQHRPGLLLR